MRFRMTLLAGAMMAAGAVQAADVATINGAGATFPYPIYAKWAEAYNKATGVKLNYQSIGSGGGIKQIKAKTVDFGATDDPMKGEELEDIGLVQFPAIMGGVVPVVNVAGVEAGKLKLDQAVLADIYLGKIANWNDAKIAALNPGMALPNKLISVVRRSDGSGTTALFTDYLAKVSPEWKETVGAGKAVKWPVGLGGKGNEGVASYVKQIDGAIGYVEYAYAKQNKLAHAQLKNKDGNYVQPDGETFAAAAANADWTSKPGYGVVLTEQAGAKAWPITGASFILVYKEPENCAATEAALKFFDYAYKNGSKLALDMDYVPMPASVVQQIKATWADEVKCDGVAAMAK
ncbi:MAG: phosphate ABC transporter substrate-binding protein PstS [Halothiobacillaceae bacterium]|nr:MAG: phosphate ABC transporter substrate-binding protein PstS [Halothiobacillaceae bacterium]